MEYAAEELRRVQILNLEAVLRPKLLC